MKIKKGDIVGRKSYKKDILFVVDKIIKINNNTEYAILKGLTIRIEADSPVSDLELINKKEIDERIRFLDEQIKCRVNKLPLQTYKNSEYRKNSIVYTGKILHLDGDRRYSAKSSKYYREMGLNAIVRNITESRQPYVIKDLIYRYKPDILVITGHDAMLKKCKDYNNIYNYKNSKHFVTTVKEARKVIPSQDELVIFAGACQSFFEALILAGANFASSPERILIDFIDPLIVAEKVAITDSYKYITIHEIIPELKEGMKGVGGTRAKGKKEIIVM